MADINKAFPAPQGISLSDTVGVFQGTGDPSSISEVAPRGSIYLRQGTDGEVWIKYGDGDTDWSKISERLLNIISHEPTGFPNTTDSTIDFSDSSPDRTFTITPAVSSFYYYICCNKYTVSSADSVQITDTEGLWFIYYNTSCYSILHTHTRTGKFSI